MTNKLSTIVAIIFFILSFSVIGNDTVNNSTNTTSESITEIIDPPSAAALSIIVDSLSSLKELSKQNKATVENISTLINIKLLPHLAISTSTELTLKGLWKDLSSHNKQLFQRYVVQSLVKDYATIFASYENLDSVNIAVDPIVKRKGNKAIVKLNITFNDDPNITVVSLKMIRLGRWRIYDVIFSGVSLVKNYRSQFDSYINRKGLDALVDRISEKTN